MRVDPPADRHAREQRPEDEQDRVAEARAQGWKPNRADAPPWEMRRTPVGPRFRRRPSWGAGASRSSASPWADAGREAALGWRAQLRPRARASSRAAPSCPSPSVLELGTLQSVPGRSTLHRDWVPHAAEFLGTDIQAGPDVDIVADLHRLSERSRHRALRRDPLGVDVRAPQVPHPGRPRADEGPQGRWPAVHPDPPVVPAARLPERLLPLLPGRPCEPVRHDHGLRGRGDQLRLPGAALLAARDGTQQMPAFLNTTLWGEKRAPTPDEYRYEL